MTKTLELAANAKYAESFGGQRQPAITAKPPFRDPDLYGCPP